MNLHRTVVRRALGALPALFLLSALLPLTAAATSLTPVYAPSGTLVGATVPVTSGTLVTLPGFGISLSLGASQSSSTLGVPSWLPLQITYLALNWPNFSSNPANFTITLSASVTSLNGLPLTVSGSVTDLEIDVGALLAGRMPIVGIGAASISISGNLFGAQASGS